MRLLVTGATGFLGWRTATVLRERGHDVLALARPGRASRAHAAEMDVVEGDAGDPEARGHLADCDAVLHFAGVPDPARARADPARAVRENAGTTANLLEGCLEHGVPLVYPSSVRAAVQPAPDPYALSKRLGEDACRAHAARSTIVRLTSVFGPGQVHWEGATGAIAAFAARALRDEPLVIPGDPSRTRDFLYVDDLALMLEQVVSRGTWGETVTAAAGVSTSLVEAAELVRDAVGSASEVQTPGGDLPPGENASYQPDGATPRIPFDARPLAEAVSSYVDWLRRHPAAQGRARA